MICRIAVFALLLAISSAGYTCQTTAWSEVTPGVTVASPTSTTPTPRVQGNCALRVSDDYVGDFSPGNESYMTVRFYFTLEGDGSAVIFQSFPNEFGTSPNLSIRVDAATLELSLAQSMGTAEILEGWNFIEIQIGVGANRLWLNADPFNDPPSLTFNWDSTVDSVRLGSISPIGDITVFADEYESRRTVTVGPLTLGDANGDQTIDESDVEAVLDEILGDVLNYGLPDCNLDTRVDIQDVVCIQSRIGAKSRNSRDLGMGKIISETLFADGFESGGSGMNTLRIPPLVLVPDPDETSPILAIEFARALNNESIDLPLLLDAAGAQAFQFFTPYDPTELVVDVSTCGAMSAELTVRCKVDNGIIAVAGFGSGGDGMADFGTIALTPTNVAEGPISLDIASPLFAVDDQSLLPVVTMGGELLVSTFLDGFEFAPLAR